VKSARHQCRTVRHDDTGRHFARPSPKKKGSPIRTYSCWLDFLSPVNSYGVQTFEFSPAALLTHAQAPPLPHPFRCMGLLYPSSPTPSEPSKWPSPRTLSTARSESATRPARHESVGRASTRISLRPVPSLVDSDPSHDPSHLTRFESARQDPIPPRSASTTP
jgi:hypothetical protein